MKYLLSALFGFFFFTNLEAQISLSTHFDIGENSVSDGMYIQNSNIAAYEFGKMYVAGGVRLDIKSAAEKIFTGTAIRFGRQFSIKEFPFEIEAHTIYNPFSDWVREFNWGVLAKIQLTHFRFKLGTSFRTYSLTQTAKEYTSPQSNDKIHENWNLMYLAQYHLKPVDFNWNVGVSITNIDYFLINQETNPMINLNGRYELSESLSLFAEAWYKASGFSNISVNYFGFFIRTGIIWNIDLNK